MDELATARAELAQFRRQEQDLLEQLSIVRTNLRAHHIKIEERIRRKLSPINLLPTEILIRILDLSIYASPHKYNIHRKNELAAVSRHWADIIHHSPVFWTRIQLDPSWSKSLVDMHVKRSGHCPLDIIIRGSSRRPSQTPFSELLDGIIPCAPRWRSLSIMCQASRRHTALVLGKMNRMAFPSLTSLSIIGVPDTSIGMWENHGRPVPGFLRPEKVPKLQSLELRGHIVLDDFAATPGLRELILEFPHQRHMETDSFLYFPSLQGLRTLSLSGHTAHWELRCAIDLPFLEHFICEVSHPKGLLEALSVPKLTHFKYGQWEVPMATVCAGLESKFAHVRDISHLSVCLEPDVGCGANALCLAFPGVRHARLQAAEIFTFVDVEYGLCAADHWEHLESLTIEGSLDYLSQSMYYFISPWLKQRRSRGMPKLQVKYAVRTDANHNSLDDDTLYAFYASLHEYCNLVLLDGPLSSIIHALGSRGDDPGPLVRPCHITLLPGVLMMRWVSSNNHR
ncbi:hypothetical protein ID866_8907 [Astraeus odoratus]|nr:hypothetical protein ID866_8907 [Astraeus odoratus]